MNRVLKVFGATIVVVLAGCQSLQLSDEHTEAGRTAVETHMTASTAGAAIAGSVINSDLAVRSSKAMIRVFFDSDTARTELGVLAEYIPEGVGVLITGHTDALGTSQYNLQLGLRRARFVADHLSDAGVERARLSVVSKGESEPIASNDTVVGRAKNRRVEVRVSR